MTCEARPIHPLALRQRALLVRLFGTNADRAAERMEQIDAAKLAALAQDNPAEAQGAYCSHSTT